MNTHQKLTISDLAQIRKSLRSLETMSPPLPEPVQRAHDEAVTAGRDFYIDPQSGLLVMTSKYLSDRGYCCNNNCRHCPYR